MKQAILVILLLSGCFSVSYSQKKISPSLRVSGQLDFQKEYFREPGFSGGGLKNHRSTGNGFGFDVLAEKAVSKKWSVFIGAGYFRTHFSFKKNYDHSMLNYGDSLGIGTATSAYNYSLLRVPAGLLFSIAENNKRILSIGLEHQLNYRFRRKYEGGKPFPGANMTYNKFGYFGNSATLFFAFSKKMTGSHLLRFSPYVRVFNVYKQDKILYEDENKSITRYTDAVGLSIQYSFR